MRGADIHNQTSPLQLRNTHILLVEDNAINQEVAIQILAQYGCHITSAKNGAAAVEEFEQKIFDLIFMDCLMPGMDGFEATQAIRIIESERELTATPIIAFTANAMHGDREKCSQAGMDDFIPKPVRQQDLERILSIWISDDKHSHDEEINHDPIEINDADNALVDAKILQELKNIMGDQFGYLIEEYIQMAPELLYDIGQAINDNDHGKVKEAAHKLKAPTAQVGAIPLSKIIGEIETLANNNTTNGALSLHKKAATLFSQAEKILRKMI